MSLRRPGEDAVLTSEEIAMVAWAGAHAGPAWHEAAADITAAAGRGRTAGGIYYGVNLAIDYLDFAAPARSSR